MCAAAAVEQREYLKCWASIVCTAAAAAIGAAAFRGYNIVAHFTLGYVERRNLPATMAALPPLPAASRSERASAHHNYLLAGCNFSPFSQVHCCEISARLLSRRQQQPPQPTASYLLAHCFFLPCSACPAARLEFCTAVSTEHSMVRAPPQEMKITFPEVQYSGGRTSPVNFVFSSDFVQFYNILFLLN